MIKYNIRSILFRNLEDKIQYLLNAVLLLKTSNLKKQMEYNIREKDQVVKAALVEEKSRARKHLHHLAPLFPDLGELD